MKYNDDKFFKSILNEPSFDPNIDNINNQRVKSAYYDQLNKNLSQNDDINT